MYYTELLHYIVQFITIQIHQSAVEFNLHWVEFARLHNLRLTLGEAGGKGGEEDEDEEGGAGAGRGRPVAEVIIATPTVRQAL